MIKSLLIVLSLFTVVGCSSSSSDKPAGGGGGNVVEKAAAGTWISECRKNDYGFFIDKMTMQNGNGTTTQEYFQNQECSGISAGTQGPTSFQYTLGTTNGNTTEVTITFAGQPAFTASVTIDGPYMTIVTEGSKANYRKLEATNKVPDGPNTPAANDFDRAAKGTWSTQECALTDKNTESYYTIITFYGNGQGSKVFNVYQNQRCEGKPELVGEANFTYTVDRYANGGGQITLNNDPVDITINGNSMTANSTEGSYAFRKIN